MSFLTGDLMGKSCQEHMADNSFLSTYRVTVEHSFGALKNFEIIKSYRSDYWMFNNIFKVFTR